MDRSGFTRCEHEKWGCGKCRNEQDLFRTQRDALLEALKLLVTDAIDSHGKGMQGALDYAKEVIEKIEKGESHGTNQ